MKSLYFLGALLLAWPTLAQDVLTGHWAGELPQPNGAPAFRYEVQLSQQGEAVSGVSFSQSADGKLTARFELSGRWDGSTLSLQEVRQLEPSSPQWCLKFAVLKMSKMGGYPVLSGDWTARGCQPGAMSLRRVGDPIVTEAPFTYAGRWAGQLSQTDRNYGFFFEINLQPDGTGTSSIISEAAGGEATHRLRWALEGDELALTETEVSERTDPNWRWCIKALRLRANRDGDRYHLEGNWSGYIEGTDPARGACAPGQVVLEKPVLSTTTQAEIQPVVAQYGQVEGRPVRVDRVVKVQSNNLRIAVWDNGVVDGDIVTLFLNGNRILHDHRVNKAKRSFPVQVAPGDNLLILHAEDLGDISPNTVAVSLNDGVSEQIIIMSSNLRESGAILIQPFSRE